MTNVIKVELFFTIGAVYFTQVNTVFIDNEIHDNGLAMEFQFQLVFCV